MPPPGPLLASFPSGRMEAVFFVGVLPRRLPLFIPFAMYITLYIIRWQTWSKCGIWVFGETDVGFAASASYRTCQYLEIRANYAHNPEARPARGSLTGGLATITTTWISQRTQSKRDLMRAEINKRETLYGEFIGECSRLLMDSLMHTLDKPDAMLPAYALSNRIRLSASDAVLAEAEEILKRLTQQYFSPNLSLEELRALVESGSDADPLKAFGEACRSELKSMHTAV